MEWGCMQALIDFDGWRKWKDFSSSQKDKDDSPKATTSGKGAFAGLGKPAGSGAAERRREKRTSAGSAGVSAGAAGGEGLETVREREREGSSPAIAAGA